MGAERPDARPGVDGLRRIMVRTRSFDRAVRPAARPSSVRMRVSMPSPSARSLPPDGSRSTRARSCAAATEPLPRRRRRRGAVLALLAAVTLVHAAVLREAMAIDLPRPAAQGGEPERTRRAVVVVRTLVAAAPPPAAATAGGSELPQAAEAGEAPAGTACRRRARPCRRRQRSRRRSCRCRAAPACRGDARPPAGRRRASPHGRRGRGRCRAGCRRAGRRR